MKYICLNQDACGFSKKVLLEELTQEDLQNPFKDCENCKYLMVLVKSDFDFSQPININFLHNIITKSD